MKKHPSNDGVNSGLDDGWRHVRDFHLLCGHPIGSFPSALSIGRTEKWSSWMTEEVNEFSRAKLIEDQADAAMDLIYFALGALVEMGVPPQKIFESVHKANLAKALPNGKITCTEDGKVIKPQGWIAPQLEIQAYIESLANTI